MLAILAPKNSLEKPESELITFELPCPLALLDSLSCLFWQVAGLNNEDGSRYVMESELTVANLKVMKCDMEKLILG